MSRIGKQPVALPAGVTPKVSPTTVSVQGPRGTLSYKLGSGVEVILEDGALVVRRISGDKQAFANFGTTRALLNNMVIGVTEGWKRSLELSGVGYRATISGQKLTLNVGLSYQVDMDIPREVSCKVDKNTTIHLESNDRELMGNIAAKIRRVRPPEPYLGKGIKYAEETIRRKAGKAGK
mgnify:CR=1 FL=1